MWHIEDEETGIKFRVKRYEMRDGLDKAKLEVALSERIPENPTADDDLEALYSVNYYPLLRFGIAEAEGVELPLSEESFWKLPEDLVLELSEHIREVNKQYALPFSDLQKMIATLSSPKEESGSIPMSEAGVEDKTISTPD